MDWTTSLQKAIDFIEENLAEELDYSEIGSRACLSSFHFQRIFSIMCSFSLGEYIRNRRLTLAGAELNLSGGKVIDIALKYGYDSPDSFTKAFTRFHGITPSAAREPGASLRSYSRLSIKLSLEGGNVMDYRIEKKRAFKVVGKLQMFNSSEELNRDDIPTFWGRCHADGTVKELYKMSRNTVDDGMVFGVCYDENIGEANRFPYLIAATYEKSEIPIGYSVKEIPEYTWAVFRCVGAMPQAIQTLWRRIYAEFFPASEYRPVNGINIEAYYEGNMDDEKYISEIWIPVERK